MITLYGRMNAWHVRKVIWLLHEIGLDFKRLDYGRGHAPLNTPEFLALNPNGLVPVLDDGGFILWESNSILRYLAAKYGAEELYPADVRRRAIVDQWLDWQLSVAVPPIRILFYALCYPLEPQPPEAVEAALASAGRAMGVLDARLANAPYVAGPTFSIADCALGVTAHRWMKLDADKPDLPALSDYYARISERPAFKTRVAVAP
ncbi:MAG: glutathione S-transferase family protein [Hyphomicrobiales bacterium]|nr:glutathione S-transferase family protein [Hyphomicrobiales bacterium]